MAKSESQLATPPAPEELELSLFGPGYGECVVVHLGYGDWIIVDSCYDSETKKPAALAYLNKIGVNPASSVRLVVASHWDDDHIRGLAEVYRSCEAAAFSCSLALENDQFKNQLAILAQSSFLPGGSGFDEIMGILRERKRRLIGSSFSTPNYATENTVLWERQGTAPAEVRALSPSNAGVMSAIGKLVAAATQNTALRRKLPQVDDNHASVVIALRVCHHSILLGGDLQLRSDPALGWGAILQKSENISPFGAYKIAHHGSPNGDHEEIWSKLLTEDPIAVVTPFVKGRHTIPSIDDCRRILSRTQHSFITSPPFAKYKDDNRIAQQEVRDRLEAVISQESGQVRVRWSTTSGSPEWECTTFGRAMPTVDCLNLLTERERNSSG